MAVVIPQPLPGERAALPRRAVWAVWGGLAASAALAGAGALTYLWPRQTPTMADAGSVDAYAVGSVRHFSADIRLPDRLSRAGYYVVRRRDGVVAFAAFCTHQTPG